MGIRTVGINLEPSENADQFDDRHYGPVKQVVPGWPTEYRQLTSTARPYRSLPRLLVRIPSRAPQKPASAEAPTDSGFRAAAVTLRSSVPLTIKSLLGQGERSHMAIGKGPPWHELADWYARACDGA